MNMLMMATFARHLTPSYVHTFFQRGNMGVIMLLIKMTGIVQNKSTTRTTMLNDTGFYSPLRFTETLVKKIYPRVSK